MFKVIMVSPGGTKRDFHGGFETNVDAADFVYENNGEYCDENGFVWNLEVVEEDERFYDICIPNKRWAETFLEFRQHSDLDAINYLSDIMENSFTGEQRRRYRAIVHLVNSCWYLNHVVALMDSGEIKDNYDIISAYQLLMCELIEAAEEACKTI